ncbi:MAG TPA: FMN-binding protein [Jatrophihabitantaceae bacterium]|nr:FMN-binding protein [Jatrophihabitantaceae bacterium]
MQHSTTAAPPPPPPPVSHTYTGQAVRTRYGTVQVQVTMTGSTITNVSFLQLSATDSRSQQINANAGPILLEQTLAAQSAQIDGVSGATYTTQGYEQSLQSALDQA